MRWLYVMSGLLLSVVGQSQSMKPDKGGNGLVGEYFAGPAFNRKVLLRTDPQIDFSWDGYTLPAPGVPPKSFSVRWTGKVYAPVSGPYRFTAVVDDGIRIWVDGKLAMDEWRYRKQKLAGQSVQLKAGQFYDLKVEYYNANNGGYVQLNWNLVNESGKAPAFEDAPQQKISGQFLYNGPISKAATLPPGKPKPTIIPVNKLTPLPLVITRKKPPADVRKPKTPLIKSPVSVSGPANSSVRTASSAPPDSLATGEPVKAPRSVSIELPTVSQIAFAQSDYQLLPSAYPALDQLALAMRSDTTIRLTVAGHTDNVGDPRLNLALSENRAKVVRFYLVRRGVSEARIKVMGFGGERPVAENDTEMNRAKNRRVEFNIRR